MVDWDSKGAVDRCALSRNCSVWKKSPVLERGTGEEVTSFRAPLVQSDPVVLTTGMLPVLCAAHVCESKMRASSWVNRV